MMYVSQEKNVIIQYVQCKLTLVYLFSHYVVCASVAAMFLHSKPTSPLRNPSKWWKSEFVPVFVYMCIWMCLYIGIALTLGEDNVLINCTYHWPCVCRHVHKSRMDENNCIIWRDTLLPIPEDSDLKVDVRDPPFQNLMSQPACFK